MKKLKLNSKLSLGKETITKLNDDSLNSIIGGAPELTEASCAVSVCVRCPRVTDLCHVSG